MKKSTLLLIFSFIALISFSQSRIGSTANDIKEEFSDNVYNLKSGYDKDGDYYIKIDEKRATVLYYFNENKLCYMTIISPDNQGALNWYVERYNKLYVITSSTTWKMYSEYGVSNIELFYPKGGGYMFIWKKD